MYIKEEEKQKIKNGCNAASLRSFSQWELNNLFKEIKVEENNNLFFIECEYCREWYFSRESDFIKMVIDKDGFIRRLKVKKDDYVISYFLLDRIENIETSTLPYSLKEEKEKERLRKIEEERKKQERLYFESGSRLYNRFLNRYIENNNFKIKEKLENNKYKLLITFNNEIFQFKIGNEKLYIVKDLRELIENFRRKSIFEYGKFLKLSHDISLFDEPSKMIYDYIRSYTETNNEHSKGIPLNYANTFIDSLIENREFLKDNITFNIIETNDKIKLEFIKTESYLKIDIKPNSDIDGFYISEKNIFYQRNNELCFFEKCNEDLIEFIKLRQNNNSVYIANEDIPRFYKYTYLKIIDLVESVGYDFSDLNEIDESITITGDVISNDEVGFEIIAAYESGHYNIFDIEDKLTSENLDAVKSVFDTYSNDVIDKKYIFEIDSENTITFINDYLPYLTDKAEILISEQLKRLGSKKRYQIKLGVGVSNGLLQINVNTDDFDVNEIGKILESYHKKRKYYKLKTGEIISLNSDELKELDELVYDYHLDTDEFKEGEISTNLYRTLAIDNSIDDFENVEVERKESFKKYLDNIKENADDLTINKDIKGILRSYQIDGVHWMNKLRNYNFGGILADDMGLGKTLEVLTLLSSIKEGTSIVVCPSSLILNWESECHKFTKDLKCKAIYGKSEDRTDAINNYKDYDLLITSYDYLRRDEEIYKDIEFNYIILDEAQYIKNQTTKNSKVCKSLNGKHRLALTGTPIENSLAELWSIFDFLMKDYLYPYNYFRNQFETDIVKNKDETKSQRLKKLVKPFILRRTKKEVLKDLPDKIEQTISFEFNDDEAKIYKANAATVAKNLKKEIKNQSIDRIQILAMLTRLRQLCLDRRLVYDDIDEISSKLDGTMELLTSLKENNKKTLLFSAFTTALDLIEDECKRNGINYLKLTGSTNKVERKKMVDQFQKGEADVFLISLKAGGTGLNLTKAEAVIHFDPWWNVSAQNQATDRAYRIGQENVLNVYKLIMKDSIEERILKLQESKKELSDLFIEGNNGSISSMSMDDIMELFK